MNNEYPYTNNGLDLTTCHGSIQPDFYQSVSDYAEHHCCSQCSNFDDHLDMSSIYKDGQNEAFTEAISK